MPTTFAHRLKELREKIGLSQEELAVKSGLNRFTIAKLEQGAREPALATAQALAQALGESLAVFADTVPSPEEPAKSSPGRPSRKSK